MGHPVAGPRAGLGLQAPPHRQDGAFQFQRDARGDVVAGPGQVVQALGAEVEVAAPPLVEPDHGAAQGLTDLLHRPAAEAERDGSLASAEIVVLRNLRSAAAGGCLRRNCSREKRPRTRLPAGKALAYATQVTSILADRPATQGSDALA